MAGGEHVGGCRGDMSSFPRKDRMAVRQLRNWRNPLALAFMACILLLKPFEMASVM